MHRTILLQTEATTSKNIVLADFLKKAIDCANWVLSQRTEHNLKTLWAGVGTKAKSSWGFNSQVVCDIVRSVVKAQGTRLASNTVKFNVPRNCKTFRTKHHFFVELGLYPRQRVAVPVSRNRNLDRFFGLLGNGWTLKTFALTPSLEIAALMCKQKEQLPQRPNLLGIDINAKRVALSVVSPGGRILFQSYLGEEIWVRRHQIMKRRSILQSFGATRALERLKTGEADFVRTNIGRLVRQVIGIANTYQADVAIERLRRFSAKGKRFNRVVMRIPFMIFRRILSARCYDNEITLNMVDPWHTSKWCIRCGAAGKGHSAIYSVFRCTNCGLTMNADRKASVAIAVKSLLERKGNSVEETFQISGRRVPVMALIGSSNEVSALQKAVPCAAKMDESSLRS